MDESNQSHRSEGRDRMGIIHSENFKEAVTIVRGELSEEAAKILRYTLEKKVPDPTLFQQQAFGVAIRNLLARKGIVWRRLPFSVSGLPFSRKPAKHFWIHEFR